MYVCISFLFAVCLCKNMYTYGFFVLPWGKYISIATCGSTKVVAGSGSRWLGEGRRVVVVMALGGGENDT